jgi:hypothetical protein
MIEGAVQAAVTTKEPLLEALSAVLSVLTACTLKIVVPPGVPVVVLMVNVDVLAVSVGVKETGFGEKDAAAPAGNVVVTLRFAVNAPEDPEPVPRFTATINVAVFPAVTGFGDCPPTVTEPTLGPSVNTVCATKPDD